MKADSIDTILFNSTELGGPCSLELSFKKGVSNDTKGKKKIRLRADGEKK